MAEGERDRIRRLQREGTDVAIQNRTVFGRPKVTVTEEFKHEYDRRKTKEITSVKAMKEIGVKKNAFYKLAKR
ncbi:hypothetical protein PB01_17225 [Psychrobacillus glaciei]|uniref:Recombinase family protein n=1 Tax=Psychrobacillus glaciei TaxID=2283160 RepID=A0A5J6SSB8_9BACI|nr:hypothetical protein [Psychrobacillus glaciei]QFG00404.1 hypothetical protein PB01_17225 [Psychrobacillus glaciei]